MQSFKSLIEQNVPEDLGIEWSKEEIENIPAWIRRSDPEKARKMAKELAARNWGKKADDKLTWPGKDEETPAFQRKAGVATEKDLTDTSTPTFKRVIARTKRSLFQDKTGLNVS